MMQVEIQPSTFGSCAPRTGKTVGALLTVATLLLLPPAIPHLLAVRNPPPPTGPADVLFVLSGGAGRVREGYRAWSNGVGRELYILGAGRDVSVEQILPASAALPSADRLRIHLEGWSENTLENAFSAKLTVAKEKYSKVILVTSEYHLPRAALAFRKVLPESVSIFAIRVRGEEGTGKGARWRWFRQYFLEGWKYWGYRVLLRWE